MVQSCVVVGCTNRWKKGSKVSWHRIPPETTPERRMQWLAAINRKDWVPKNEDRVCGRHFITGCASLSKENPDYAPSLEMGYDKVLSSTPDVKKHRFERAQARQQQKTVVEEETRAVSAAASALLDLSNTEPLDTGTDADTENSPQHPKNKMKEKLEECVEELARTRLQNKMLLEEFARLKSEKDQLSSRLEESRFGVGFLRRGNQDYRTNFYTGVPNFATLMWLVTFLQSSLPSFSSVLPEDVVLIVLIKLKLNLMNFDIATRFGISPTTVSDILNRSIPIVAEKLKFLVHWPEKDDVIRTLPKVFRSTYKNARSIIDCTELFIDRPGNLTARASTWSNYKHNNTLKYLVSITPCGAISFISKAFGGRTSDKIVTQRSGFLDMLEHGDVVLADRGFLIEDDIAARNCYLVMPSFTKGQTQLSQKQVEVSRQMSRVRIHVERAIGRLKNFKILSTTMTMNMVPHADSILTICSAICNLQPKLVK